MAFVEAPFRAAGFDFLRGAGIMPIATKCCPAKAGLYEMLGKMAGPQAASAFCASPAPSFKGQQVAGHAQEGRFQPAPTVAADKDVLDDRTPAR